jgi:type I restriction enzyme S subunit
VGFTVIMGRPMATSQDFVNWVCGPELNPRYLMYVLMLEQDSIRRFAHGTTHQTMYYPEAKALHIAVPDRVTQDQVVAVLGGLDGLIDTNQALSRSLVGLADALYADSVADASVEATVGDIAVFENYKRVPLSSKERLENPGSYPYYGATGQMGLVGGYLFDGERVLVGEDGSVVRSNGTPIVQHVTGKYWVNNHAHVLSGNGISTSLLRIVLRSTYVATVVTGAVQAKLSMGNLKSVPVLLPVTGTLDTEVQALTAAEVALRAELAQLRRTRDELLPLLLSGSARVDEVAA